MHLQEPWMVMWAAILAATCVPLFEFENPGQNSKYIRYNPSIVLDLNTYGSVGPP